MLQFLGSQTVGQDLATFTFTFELLWWLSGKESVCNAEDPSSIPGLGRSPGWGNGNPLQCACLENSLDKGAWQASARVVTKSQT